MKTHGKIIAGVSMLLVLGLAGHASAEKPTVPVPPSIEVTVNPGISDEGVGFTINGNNWRYSYGIVSQATIDDFIPFEICSKTTVQGDEYKGYPLTVEIGPNGEGGNLEEVTYPASVIFNEDGCQIVEIKIVTEPLAAGNYSQLLKFELAKDKEADLSLDTNNIHIEVDATATDPISCFITDSSFNFLATCDGTLVTSGDDGRFTIVTNKKGKQAATNPGQFYYNVLWTNLSDADVIVDVDFDRNGVNPQGAQAIHAEVFPAFPNFDIINFEEVNDAIPGGADDFIGEIMVPAGATLWVDYHLEWDELGTNNPVYGDTCDEAGSDFSVTATVTAGGVDYSCGAGASGYKK